MESFFDSKLWSDFPGVFLGEERAPREISRANKSQLQRHGIHQPWVFRIGKCIWVTAAFLLGRVLWGLPCSLCWYPVTHTPAGREFRHIPSVGVLIFFKSSWWGVCQQTCHSVDFWGWSPLLRPRDISEMQSRIVQSSLSTYLCWKCKPLLSLLFWKLLRVIKFRLSSEVKHAFIYSQW